MSPLTTSAIPQELQRDALLTLEQLTTSITVLALHASHRQEDTPSKYWMLYLLNNWLQARFPVVVLIATTPRGTVVRHF